MDNEDDKQQRQLLRTARRAAARGWGGRLGWPSGMAVWEPSRCHQLGWRPPCRRGRQMPSDDQSNPGTMRRHGGRRRRRRRRRMRRKKRRGRIGIGIGTTGDANPCNATLGLAGPFRPC
eukprot:9500118-Pyramimonas_sp.AAC.1